MERYGHLQLEAEVRWLLLAMSAATMDRLLRPVREIGKQGRRRPGINTHLRRSIAVRTFNDWNDPPPGLFEMDMVAHCGTSGAGSHANSLVLTDIASGWTEAAAMVVREQTLITVTLEEVRRKLAFPMLGLDVDNDSAFINQWRTRVDPFQDVWLLVEQWLDEQPDATAKALSSSGFKPRRRRHLPPVNYGLCSGV
jgi:hypothetical protein